VGVKPIVFEAKHIEGRMRPNTESFRAAAHAMQSGSENWLQTQNTPVHHVVVPFVRWWSNRFASSRRLLPQRPRPVPEFHVQ